jgi:hypothetical protein
VASAVRGRRPVASASGTLILVDIRSLRPSTQPTGSEQPSGALLRWPGTGRYNRRRSREPERAGPRPDDTRRSVDLRTSALNSLPVRSILRPFPKGGPAGAGGGNTLVIFTVTVAGLARGLQKERDLSAVFIGDPSSGPQGFIVQRQLVDQVPVPYQAGVGEANAGRYSERVRAALARVRRRLAGLHADRQAIDAPRLGLADSLGSSARLADNS